MRELNVDRERGELFIMKPPPSTLHPGIPFHYPDPPSCPSLLPTHQENRGSRGHYFDIKPPTYMRRIRNTRDVTDCMRGMRSWTRNVEDVPG